jgi:S1/P1 nuclease
MRIVMTCLLAWMMTVSPAIGWNATGHKIIASIAFRRLTGDEQARIVAILKRHPRFAEDFGDQMPEEVRGADVAAQNEWLFQQAAIWPDTVRSGPVEKRAFNRGEWHYVNVPHFLTEAARSELAGRLPARAVLKQLAD